MCIDKDQIQIEIEAFNKELDLDSNVEFIDLGHGMRTSHIEVKPVLIDENYFLNTSGKKADDALQKLRSRKARRIEMIKQALIDRPHVVTDSMRYG